MKRFILTCVVALVVFSSLAGAKENKKADPPLSTIDSIRKITGDSLAAKKPVLLYFYSESIPDSREALPVLKTLVESKGGVIVDMEALEIDDLRYGYGVEYVPTLILIRPDVGVAAKWVVDIPQKEVEAALSMVPVPNNVEKQIAGAISKHKPQLYFFNAKWCGYCMKLLPQIDRFQQDFSDRVEVVKIDVDLDNNARLKDRYSVGGIPVVLIVDKSGIVANRTGYPDGYDQYRMYFKTLGVNMDKPGTVKVN